MSIHHPRNVLKVPAQRQLSAFTIVELLVVIGIISVLISLLLPALIKARAAATQIACASNLRTLGQAVFIYAGENHGSCPPIFGPDFDGVHYPRPCVYGLLEKYGIANYSTVRTCPTVMANLIPPPNTDTFSYIYSSVVGGDQGINGNGIAGPLFFFIGATLVRTDQPLKLTGPFISNTGMFADCYQYGIHEGPGSGVPFYPGMPQYRWGAQTTTAAGITKVKIIADAWGGQHQALFNFSAVHKIKYTPNGQVSGQNNVCYCDGSVRVSIIQYTPGSPNGIIWTDTGLVPNVAP